MVVSSLEVCMDSVDWSQSYCANLCKSGLTDTVMPCSRPPLLADRRPKPPPEQALKCPRCDSTNTKFCYYNNYNLSQPRHFCKSCRRYWTKGGALRNVPVGGGCRKNKRAKKTHTPDNNNNEASTSTAAQSNPTDMPNCSAYEATTVPVTSDPLFFGNALHLTGIPFTRLQQDNPTSFLCGEPTIINPFKNTSLDYSTLSRDQNSVFDPQLSRSLASALYLSAGLDSELQWKLQQHQHQQPQTNKLCFPSEEGHNNNNTEAHDFLAFEQHSNATDQKPDVVKNISSTVIKEEPNSTLTTPDWQVPVSEPLFGGDSGAYWNGGAWPDISSFGSTITQLL